MKRFNNNLGNSGLLKKSEYGISAISKFMIFFLLFLIPCIMLNCDKEIKKLIAPDETHFPGTPTNVKAIVDDASILISWQMSDTSGIHYYYIYRKDSVVTEMGLLDSSFVMKYEDNNVINERIYYYQVAAVNDSGYVGKRSAEVSARPNMFNIIIENGEEYTNNKRVTLTLIAPSNTRNMMFANDSLFINASWINYTTTMTNWELSQGDGTKFVYVKFKDYDGNVTKNRIFDTIILDTKAIISEVTENTNGQIKVPGQNIHFTLNSGEQAGTATIDIGNAATGIKLYDDGTSGDTQANDGLYEVEYRIPSGIKTKNAIVTGHFTDRVNNVAEDATALGRVTIGQDPLAVTLYPPTTTGEQEKSLELYWSQYTDDDFSSYRLYRKTSAGVDTLSNLVTTINNKETTNHTDTGVKENIEYYYRVFVFDTFGGAKGSNEVKGQVSYDDENPTPVSLLTPTPVGNSLTSLHLTWSKNSDDDFESYRIYRTEAPAQVDSTSFLVNIIYDQDIINYDDADLKEDTEYNYQIYVFDTGGKSAGSNKVTGKTNANEPPTPVTLLKPTPVGNSTNSLTLSWSKNADEDFSSYRIYREEAPAIVDSNSFVVEIIYDQNTTNYEDSNLKDNTEYNYRVYVFDTGGSSAGSNTVIGKTNDNNPPTAVTLLTPTPVMNSVTSLNLIWSKNGDEDFESYRIYRAESPQEVNTTSFLVDVLYDQSITNYQDTNLKENTEYNYRVYVFDTSGKSTGSNMVTGKTNVNNPPTAVSLLTPTPVMNSVTSLNLIWSINEDVDFESYRIYRAESPQEVNTTSFLVDVLYNQSITNYQDTNLKENTEYNYRVYVFDTGGKSTGSNMVTGKTNENQPPNPVTLLNPTPVGNSTTSLNLSWSKNADEDFVSYRIYREQAPTPVDSNSFAVDIIYDQNTTYYEDTNLKEDTQYNYRVYVFDEGGKAAGSNMVTGKTNFNEPPTAVTLLTPTPVGNLTTSLNLSWSKNADEDFVSYRIYREQAPKSVDSNSFVIGIIYNQNTTDYEDANLKENTEYNYRVYVFDDGGKATGSNMVTGKTNFNEPPTAVTLLPPLPVRNSSTSLNLSWSKNADEDFVSYRIYREEAPKSVDSNSFVAEIIYDQNTTDYEDTNLKEDTQYNYRIYVFDEGGKATGSNTATGKTNANQPPTPVVLAQPAVFDSTILELTWTQNNDLDFQDYQIYRSETSPVNTSGVPITIISDPYTTQYYDANLTTNKTYYYRVVVTDQGGLSSVSNETSGTPRP